MEMNIQLDSRKLVSCETIEQTPTKIVSVNTYDDGTFIKSIQDAGTIKIESNKQLVVLPDRKTIKIVD